MFDGAVMQAIERVAGELGVEPAALAAVVEVESGGRVSALVDGRPEPLIRFEGYYFDRRLSGAARERARREGLASPKAGAVANPASQPARWALLSRAASIDRAAAYESVSWGAGQVMGAHWDWLGYASVDALVAEARGGIAGQVRLMARFIDSSGLTRALRMRDWPAFARGYNGPAYRKNAYDTRLARAYANHARAAAPAIVLRRGSRGEAVRALQAALARLGHALRADGVFGPLTEVAVRRFQSDRGLAVDGIAGPATMAVLRV